MVNKTFGLIATFIGLTVNAVSALNAPFSRSESDEAEKLPEKLIGKGQSNRVVLLLPRPDQHHERYLWLIAHGSHISHASHISGVSHWPGSSCQVFTPIAPALSTNAIPGCKDTKLVGYKDFPLILYLPSSTIDYPSLEYMVKTKPLYGTVNINMDGTIIYTPNPGFESTDIFSIIATDGITLTEPVTFTVNMKAQ